MFFNVSHTPPTQKAIHDARARISRELRRVRLRMMVFFIAAAFSFPLGLILAAFLSGETFSNIPGQLTFFATIAVIGFVVYKLFKNAAAAEDLEHRLNDLRPVVDDCCGLSKLTTQYPIIEEYRSAVAAQKRHMVFGEYLVIKEWFESKHGKISGHKPSSPEPTGAASASA
jgi:hypothetical protein